MDDNSTLNNYWEKAISFEEYVEISENRASAPDPEDQYQEYYELGMHRMHRALKTYKQDETLARQLEAKNFDGKILIISEPWCGDASATVPAIAKFFEGKNEVRVFLRDSDLSLIEQFPTDGSLSIPKILILNEDLSLKNVWGPRPKYGMELLKKFKTDPENYPREEFYNDLQIYYAKSRGKDVIEELMELI